MSNLIFDYLEIHAVDHCNNNCRWCNNHSPYHDISWHQAESYINWISLLEQKRIPFRMLSIMGGEPFLHPNLTEFAHKLKTTFPGKTIAVSTNGFWLGEAQIHSYAHLWRLLDVMFLSLYPNLTQGGFEAGRLQNLLQLIKQYNPALSIDCRDKKEFRIIEYRKEPKEPPIFCGTSECTTLLTNGQLARCGLGGYAQPNPHVEENFRNSRHMFFDLSKPFTTTEFWNWRRRWPFDACMYCDSYEWKMSPWKAEKNTKRRFEVEIEHDIRAGERLIAMGKNDIAESFFRSIIERAPDTEQAYNNLAVCIYQKNPVEALHMLSKAVDLNPEYSDARKNISAIKSSMISKR